MEEHQDQQDLSSVVAQATFFVPSRAWYGEQDHGPARDLAGLRDLAGWDGGDRRRRLEAGDAAAASAGTPPWN